MAGSPLGHSLSLWKRGKETGIFELSYARHGPRIVHIYGLIQCSPLTFEKNILTPILYIRNLSVRERARERLRERERDRD